MGKNKKRVSFGLIILGFLIFVLVVYYIYVHFTTTPEERAYAAAVQKVVEVFNEKSGAAAKDEEEKTESYVEKLAKDEDEVQPYFDEYQEKYVSKKKDGYLVKLPVQEMLNYEVVREYTYEVYVEEKDGEYTVVSMEQKNAK